MNTSNSLKIKIGLQLNSLLRKIGIELLRYPNLDIRRRMKLFDNFKINKIFDVGANVGNYAISLRKFGYKGDIISFEPLSNVFTILKKNSDRDNKWIAANMAIGDIDGETTINVAANTDSSSLLGMLPLHVESAPEAQYIGKEKIKICKLDTIINNYIKEEDNIFLKIDTQGFEKNVIDGAINSLPIIKGIQIEMSLVHLYEGDLIYTDMIEFLKSNGFHLYSLENGFAHPKSGQLLQVDGIFYRNRNA
jgi:FkbM family methyltransferase